MTIYTQHIGINKRDIIKRKNITVTSWDPPTDPTSYIPLDLDCTKALEYVKKLNSMQSEVKITLTHVYTKAMIASCYKNRRDIGRIKFGYFQ